MNATRLDPFGTRLLRGLLVALLALCAATWLATANGCSSTGEGGGGGGNTGVGENDGLGLAGDAGKFDVPKKDLGGEPSDVPNDASGGGAGKDGKTGIVGDFGKPCKGDEDCESGYCVEGYNGYVCTQTCGGGVECPQGFACNKVDLGGKQSVYLCLAQVSKLCHPCTSDLDCSGGACVQLNGEHFCANHCEAATGATCPSSHLCTYMPSPDGGPDMQVCLPKSGSCNCSPDTVGVVRACQQSTGPLTCYGVEICEKAGWSSCQLPEEVCDGKDNNCNGIVDEGFVDDQGKYTTPKACGACGNNCTFTTYANAQTICDDGGAVAKCAMKCAESWSDVNDNPNDGCECHFESASDFPDGMDQNCDGIDGEIGNGVFVANNGADGNDGSFAAPVATIAKGIQVAKGGNKRDVYVATGVYDESLLLVAGVNVYGGYSANFKFHDALAYETVLVGVTPSVDKPGAVNAIGIDGATTIFDGFTVYGANVKGKSESTYAVYVRDCSQKLRVTGNKIVAGDAGNGASGSPGDNGSSGAAGAEGKDAKDLTGKTACDGGIDHNAGGSGGSKTCGGTDVSGGKGGNAICPAYVNPANAPQSAEYGSDGKGSGAGAGGDPGLDGTIGKGGSCTLCTPPKDSGGNFLSSTGLNGADGGNGGAGGAGGGCGSSGGQVVGGVWSTGVGSGGGEGAPGGGGGGGGSGGGVDVTSTCTASNSAGGFKYPDVGGSGGGGGSGGCGGTGGKGGTSGGGSFGLFLVYSGAPSSLPIVSGNTLVTGNGGEGGQGGQGGVGGPGGDGKFGGGDDPKKLAWCAGIGGRGGQGGDGGSGGGGGGGCGGPSWGLFVAGASGLDPSVIKNKNQVSLLGSAGKGGQGGKSLGKDGAGGQDGDGGEANF